MSNDPTIFEVDFIELELVSVELVEKELVDINLNTIDVLPSLTDGLITSSLVFNEIPTKVNSKRFNTNYNFLSGSLRVFLNGIKEKYITIIDSNTFELPIDTIVDDNIEVNYVKL